MTKNASKIFCSINQSSFVNADLAASHVLALPIYSELKQEQIEFVVEKIKEFVEDTR